jgi:AcrR family transcriptional regulator
VQPAYESFEPPWWTPRKAPTARRSLSREVIVAAALRILRAEGIDALSMRRVAAELDTGAASLYAHVAHKDELLELLLDEVAGEIPLPEPDPERWQDQIRGIWTAAHAVLARNRDIARVAIGRIPLGPKALRVTEVSMAVLRAGGVPPRAVAWAVDVVGLYVAANAVEGAEYVVQQRAGRDPAEYLSQVQDHFAALPAERYPVIAALRGEMTSGSGDERFSFGLDMIIRGLESLVPE